MVFLHSFLMTQMKRTFYLLILLLALGACNSPHENPVQSAVETKAEKVKFHQLKKLMAIGQFDGDQKVDTIFQHNYSKRTKAEIVLAPDPFQNEWDTIEKWFYDQDALVYLRLHNSPFDTLQLGIAQGLYCLINIGDNNADGIDELALVIDHLDRSRVNTCKIYTLCGPHWKLLKQFGIHEDAFNFNGQQAPVFDHITAYLEKQNGHWVYQDYGQDAFDKQEEVGQMKPLNLDNCK